MGNQSLVSPETRSRIKKVGEPLALALGRAGLTPDALTIVGFAITLVGAALAAAQLWIAAGLVILIGGLFDMLDGTLARATGRVSRLGGFMDSLFDRWGEAAVYVGIIAGCSAAGWQAGVLLAGGAMSSAFLVSYARARAESLGFHGEVGVAPRAERVAILTVALLLAGAAGGVLATPGLGLAGLERGQAWLALGLGAIFILATITVIQRIFHVRAQAAEGRDRPS